MKRKLLAIVLAAIMLASMFPLTVSAAFSDTAGHWASSTIEKWSEAGVLNGYADGSFKPSNSIKRGEFFKVIDSVMAYKTIAENRFTDLNKSDWYYDIVLRLAAAGIVKGDGGSNTVRGEANIKREEAFVILARVFNIAPDAGGLSLFNDAAAVSEWAKAEVGGMAAAGYVKGNDGYLRPKDFITRAEVVTVIDRLIDIFIHQAGTYSGKGDIAVVNTSGAVLDGAEVKNLYVTQGVGTGEFTLMNSKVADTMYVNGGGANSIRIVGSDVNNLVTYVDSSTGAVRVSVSGNSNVTVVTINDGCDDVILDGTYTNVIVEGNSRVTVAEGTTVSSINATGDKADIVVKGTVTSITVSASNVSISGTGDVSTVKVQSGTGNSVTVAGAKVVVAESAGQVSIGDGNVVEPGTEGQVSGPSDDGTTSTGSGYVPASSVTDPYKISDIEEIKLADEVPELDSRTFGGNTQLRITGKTPGSYYVYVTVNDPEPAPDPDFDTDLLLVPELADLMLLPNAKSAVWRSHENYIETATEDTDWYSASMHGLSGADKLEDDLFIIGFRATDDTELSPPPEIEGYGGEPVSSPEELTEGSWLTVSDGDLLFVALYPEPAFEHPPELNKPESDSSEPDAPASSFIYAWPPDIAYDPNLDDNGIIPGTNVYACFELDSSYRFTRIWDPPSSITGYTKVDSPAEMGPNTWCALTFSGQSGDYSYVLVSGKVLFPVNNVTKVSIGAPSNLEFKARDEVSLEVGKRINLTALLKATGTLPDENREVTWKVAKLNETVPVTEFTARIKITVVRAEPFKAKPTLNVINGGVRSWDESPVEGDVYLGFTADVHFDKSATSGENLFRLWMESLSEKVPHIDYMTMAGDHTSAYASDFRNAWENIEALAEVADRFIDNGFVKHDNLFILGNHERWEIGGANIETVRGNTKEYPDLQEIVNRMYEAGEPPIETSNYIIVPFGAEPTPADAPWYGAEYGGAQMFLEVSITELDKYLSGQPKNIPVFVVSHFPIHTYTAPEGGDRETGNALKLISVLNKYPNVIFLWGHNHSSSDPMYDKICGPGDFIDIGPGVFGETTRINFTYAAAGAMSDFEYRSSASSTSLPGGIYINGKGMLVGISGSNVSIMWYDRPQKKYPIFKLPPELYKLAETATEKKVWYGAGAYRLYEEITESNWLYRDMYMRKNSSGEWVNDGSGGWANTGAVLGGGTSVVILGFRGLGLDAISDSITGLTGYTKAASASNMGPGKFGIVTSEDGNMVFVLLYTISDGNIWIPKYIGDAQVLSLADRTITLWDGVDDEDATNWDGTVTWDDIADSITTLGNVTTDGAGEFFNSTYANAYTVSVHTVLYEVEYNVVSGVPQKFVLPVELEALFATSYSDGTYYAWYGYAAVESAGAFSMSAISGLKDDLAGLGESIVFIGINKGLLDFSTLLPNGLTGYGETPIADGSSAFADVKDEFVPGTWFYSTSGSASYIILYTDFCTCDTPVPSKDDCTICSNPFCGKVIKGYEHTPVATGCDEVCENCGVVIIPGAHHTPSKANCMVCEACGAELPRSCTVEDLCDIHQVCQCDKCGNCGLCIEEVCCGKLGNENCACDGTKCECFKMPEELLQFISDNSLDYHIWRGYDYFTETTVDGYTVFGGMMSGGFGGTVGDLNKDVVIVGIKGDAFPKPESGDPSPIGEALKALSFADYGGPPVYHGTNTAGGGMAGTELAKKGHTWVVVTSTSSANGYVVFNILPA
ncbi:MAG: hypothetical protein GX254_06925 [Clostridiales bacterium]|jgi:hypothetical protein|nr:hypothetical protein [Clostridiales bacterium]